MGVHKRVLGQFNGWTSRGNPRSSRKKKMGQSKRAMQYESTFTRWIKIGTKGSNMLGLWGTCSTRNEGLENQRLSYHPECFVCTTCFLPLKTSSVFISNDRLFCREHIKFGPKAIRPLSRGQTPEFTEF